MIVFRKSNIKNNESGTACSECAAKRRTCCSNMPGSLFPSQLKTITVESIANLFRNGYCADWWEGDPREGHHEVAEDEKSKFYFIRPQTVGYEGRIFHGSWGGACTFLTPTGCKHEFNNRPAECQALVPNPIGSCKPKREIYTKQKAAIAWIPYQAIIEEAGELVRKENNNPSRNENNDLIDVLDNLVGLLRSISK